MEINEKKSNLKNIVTILAMSFVTLSVGAVNAALASIGVAFPDAAPTTIALVTTIPMLFSIPSALMVGKIVGKHIKYRTTVLIGVAILIIAGSIPFFLRNLFAILVFRSLFGVGVGFLTPIASALSLITMSEKNAGRQLGWNIIAANAGAIVFQMLGGFLTGFSWEYCFLAYLLIIPFWVLIFKTLKEPVIEHNKDMPMADMPKSKFKFNAKIIFWILLGFVTGTLFYSLITNLSTIIMVGGYGTPADIAVAFSAFTLGGIFGGFAFSKLVNKIHNMSFVISATFSSAGFFIIAFGQNLAMMILGAILFGIGMGMFMPGAILNIGMAVEPEHRASAISMVNASGYIGNFASAYIFFFLQNLFSAQSERFSIHTSAYVYAVIAVGFLVASIVARAKRKQAPAS